jgi:hypothetical protein
MDYPALIFWVLIALSVKASPGTLLMLLLASMPFASLSLLPPQFLAGMTILPQSMFAFVLVLKVVVPQLLVLSPTLVSALRLRHLGYLALFLLIGIVTTIIMPRLFQGEVFVMPMRDASAPDLLGPIQANITQSAYLTLSVLSAFAVTLMANERRFVATLLASMLAGGTVCVATGLIDLAAASSGLSSWLDPFHTANYAYLIDELGGFKRVIGFTPEASVYGSMCVQFAGAVVLLRPLYMEGLQRNLATTVSLGLVVMAVLSTSTTAYAGLMVLGLIYAANWIRRAVSYSTLGQSGLLWELLAGVGVIIIALFLLIVRPSLFDPLLNLIDEVVFNKSVTASFYERSHWNAVAWDTVASTWGLGVGLGSTRTSNWFAALVSNMGLIGAALMGIFLIQTLTRRATWRTPLSDELLPALKLSLLPCLMMGAVAAAGPDFGPWSGVVFGAITGVATLRPKYGSVGHIAADQPTATLAGARATTGRQAISRIIRPTLLRS